jgi:hypothetical protein
MEHKTGTKEIEGTKRILTFVAGLCGAVSVIAAIVRGIAGSQLHDYSHPVVGVLGVCMILGLFVALLALNTRLQVALDEADETPLAEKAKG